MNCHFIAGLCVLQKDNGHVLTGLSAYQCPAEEHRASAVVSCSPGDELLYMVQLATHLYCSLQLVLQPLL